MRILHLGVAYLPYIGGSTIRLQALLTLLAKRPNIEVHLLVAMDPRRFGVLPAYEIIDGVHVHRVADQTQLFLALFRLQSAMQFDAIHVHNARYGLFAILSGNKPVILEFHALREMNRIKDILTQFVCNRARYIFVLAHSAKQQLINHYNLLENRIDVLYNGIKFDLFNPELVSGQMIRDKFNLTGLKVIGYVGTFHSWQGVHILVESFKLVLSHYPDMKLLLVGDGPEKERLMTQVGELGIEKKVIFAGSVPFLETPSYLAAIDVVAITRPQTAETNSAVPLKVIEAMCMKKSVLVTPVLGLIEVVRHNQTGWVSEGFDARAISNMIVSVLDLEEDKRNSVEHMAREYVLRNFSWDVSVDKMLEAYHAI
ncbi:glycosyltransferase family 4 protein [Candidatus Viridilinea mediisalina]|nr:glycosyltransferase family 4 protein [Candidatus Viridilinea mediisalina]